MTSQELMEQRLESLGTALRRSPSIAERVMRDVRSMDDSSTGADRTRAAARRPWRLLAAVATAACVAALLIPQWMPSGGTTWADVIDAVEATKWIHARSAAGYAEMWFSPQRKLWAFKNPQQVQFSDGRQRVRYEYVVAGGRMTRYPLGEDDIDHVLPIDESNGKTRLGPWLFRTEKVVQQTQREVTENGKRWVEFDLSLARGTGEPLTLRVDPATRLPVDLRRSVEGGKASIVWTFDYPAEGPADIYALGVAADVAVDDLVPPRTDRELLDTIAAGRSRIGNFRMIVATQSGYPAWVVWRKADRWRVDACVPLRGIDPMAAPEAGKSWSQWWQERLLLCRTVPWVVCDGQSVFENSDLNTVVWRPSRIGPQDLMSGERGSGLPGPVRLAEKLFPNLAPRPGFTFAVERGPKDALGCILIKVSARLATSPPLVGHEWYYVDPAKGYSVVRAELFNLPPRSEADPLQSANRSTLRMQEFEKSPRGFWYPAAIHETFAEAPGGEAQQRHEMTLRYDLQFDPEVDDEFFRMAIEPEK